MSAIATNAPPPPPVVHIARVLATAHPSWGFDVATNDPNLSYYRCYVTNTSNHRFYDNLIPQLGVMEMHYTNYTVQLDNGTNIITFEKHYANGVYVTPYITNVVIYNYSVADCGSNGTTIQISSDLTNWTDTTASNKLFIRNKP